jgi:hypothetical protein
MKNNLWICVTALTLTACGGGGGGGGGGSDPSAYAPTTAGAGSTVSSAESTGSIKYAQYQQTATVMTATNFSVPSVTATVSFNATSKQGSIQFPVMGTNELISTTDGYATSRWTGPFMTGLYKFAGNILMGCYANAANSAEKTQVFISSSLARVKDGFIDDMNGTTFDLIDCPILEKGKPETLTLNKDGTMFLSTANATIPKNQVFDMLNPEKGFGGALINGSDYASKGSYSGQAFKYGENGVTKYAIVIQTSAGNTTAGANYHYLLAVQR